MRGLGLRMLPLRHALCAPLPRGIMIGRTLALVALLALPSACGGSAAPPVRQVRALPHLEVRQDAFALFATDYFEEAICDRLTGRFLPLPAPTEAASPAPDAPTLAPAAGRLWVTSCATERPGNTITLQLGGFGWVWVDQKKWGNHLRQYVGLHIGLSLSGSVIPAYEHGSRVATFWFVPSEVKASGGAMGEVRTSANALASLLRIATFGIATKVADEKARKKFQEELDERFTEALRSGFTVTYNLHSKQVDVSLGYLAPGQEPPRPFADGRTWLANEHVLLHPEVGGFHVLGPFDPAAGVDVDIAIPGAPIRYWAECADVTTARFQNLERDGVLPNHDVSVPSSQLAGTGFRTIRLTMPSCRWYLLATALEKPATAFLRVRGTHRTFLAPP